MAIVRRSGFGPDKVGLGENLQYVRYGILCLSPVRQLQAEEAGTGNKENEKA